MNLFEVQERLKDFSKDQLVNEMQMPSGTAPPYLVLSELQRRTRMEQAMKADGQGAPQSTVAEDAVVAAGVPQGGLADMARALAPQTDMAQNDAAAPVQMMAEGGRVSGQEQVDTAIRNVLGGPSAIGTGSAAERLGITAAGLAQAAAQPPAQVAPQMPQMDTSRIDEILARLSAPPAAQSAPQRPTGERDFYNRYGFSFRQVYGPDANWGEPHHNTYGPLAAFQTGAPSAPVQQAPNVSEADLAYVMNNAPDMAQRQMALDAMKRMGSPQMPAMPVMGMAEGGRVDIPEAVMSDPAVIAMASRSGKTVREFVEDLDPEARRQLIRNVEQQGSFDREADDTAFSRFSDIARAEAAMPGQDYLDNRPQRDALRQTSEDMGLAAIPSGLSAPTSRMMIMPPVSQIDSDPRAAAVAAYPDGRGNTPPYPAQPSIGGMPDSVPVPSPANLGIEGVINPEAAALGSGEMAAGHPLPDRLLNIPGAEEPVNRGPQYVAAMRNLIGLSDEGSAMPAQLAAEDAAMGMSPTSSAGRVSDEDVAMGMVVNPSVTDRIGEYLSGVINRPNPMVANIEALEGMVTPDIEYGPPRRRGSEEEAPRMAMSAGEVGAPASSTVPDFVTDPPTEMDALTRQSAEDAARLRDDAGIETSLRDSDEQRAAAEAAREAVRRNVGRDTPAGSGGAGSGGGGGGGAGAASAVSSGGEKSDLEKMYEQDKWLALAQFGLGLMSSKEPTFGGAVGEAGQAALGQLGQARQAYLERKAAEEELALKRMIASRRGSGGGGGSGGSGYEVGLSTDANRLLDDYKDRLDVINAGLSGYAEGEEPTPQQAQLIAQRQRLLRDMDQIRNLATQGLTGALSQAGAVDPNVSAYDLTK